MPQKRQPQPPSKPLGSDEELDQVSHEEPPAEPYGYDALQAQLLEMKAQLDAQQALLAEKDAVIEAKVERLSKVEAVPEPEPDPVHRCEVDYLNYSQLRDGQLTWVSKTAEGFVRDGRQPSVGDEVRVTCADPDTELRALVFYVSGMHGDVLSMQRAWADGAESFVVNLKPRHAQWLAARAEFEGLPPEVLAARYIARAWQHDEWRSSASSLTGQARQELLQELKAG